MPAAPQSFEPAGFGPNSNQPGVMNFQSTINPLASSDVGGTAGHVAAACVSARGECDGERVRDARYASCILPPTTLSPRARQVVVPQAQNFRASAVAIALVPQPSTIENAGADAPEVSTPKRSVHFTTDPPVDDEEGWTKAEGKTARGRAKRSAKCGTSAPFAPSVSIPVPTPAGVAPFDAVAPSVSIPVPTPAGVAPLDAVAPSVPSVAPTALRRRTVASTNDSPISQPTGAAPQHSTNDSPISQPAGAAQQRLHKKQALSKTRLYVARGSRLVASGMNPRARVNPNP